MARKELTLRIEDAGRDQGKVFFIREMSASQAEKWALRAFLALGKNGINLPEGFEHSGFAGIAKIGLELLCKLPFDDAESLMDEMFTCIQIAPNPKDATVHRTLVEDDIEEIATRLKLRVEVFKLHAGFSAAAS